MLPSFPVVDSLKTRLVTTREWAQRLTRLKPSREAILLIQRAIEDLTDAERLFGQPEANEKPHILRAVDACVDVAQWRLRGVEQLIAAAVT